MNYTDQSKNYIGISLGANIEGPYGTPVETLKKSRPLIEEFIKKWFISNSFLAKENVQEQILQFYWSSLYLTSPRGGMINQPDYNNAALVVRNTDNCLIRPNYSSCISLLKGLMNLERKLGRKRSPEIEKWSARSIDIDFLFWGNFKIENPCLSLPHPLIFERDFVLEPLSEALSKIYEKKPLKINLDSNWA